MDALLVNMSHELPNEAKRHFWEAERYAEKWQSSIFGEILELLQFMPSPLLNLS